MSRPSGEIIFAVEEAPEGGYLARALGHDIFTEADSPDALRDAVRDAVRCHFDEDDRPKVIRLHFLREEVFAAWSCRATCRDRTSPRLCASSAMELHVRRAVISA